jgi:signal transduction histidine kinase
MLDEQRAFAANASHELRTPLTTIRLRSEALRYDDLDSDTTHQYIAEIDDEAARLGNLVEDLISLSRFDAGRAERGDELVDVVRLARAVMHEVAQREDAQGRDLVMEAGSDLPELRASTQHVRIVLRNLLGNAVSYTPPGGKIICQIEKQPDALQLTFADTGQGVAPDDLPHLFERFYRADKARSRGVGGVGLGLPLVQSIVHFYGGRIEIASPGLDQGTTVRVWWPLPSSTQS